MFCYVWFIMRLVLPFTEHVHYNEMQQHGLYSAVVKSQDAEVLDYGRQCGR